jgi:ABC-type bacteriocin/lantibiotic exporter with double-glycine peptidase domain
MYYHYFPFFHQHDAMDYGATCLRMVTKYYGKNYSLETLQEKTYITREGVSLLGISEAGIAYTHYGLENYDFPVPQCPYATPVTKDIFI